MAVDITTEIEIVAGEAWDIAFVDGERIPGWYGSAETAIRAAAHYIDRISEEDPDA
jgi:hypothetical protein